MNSGDTNGRSKGRILVVDDTPANLRLLMDMLTEHGYLVNPANSGEAALRFVQSNLPDLVLLDVMMPGMDGFEVCTQLKANGRTRDIPVIFLSAADQVFDKVKAFGSGGVDYIVKPFQVEEVLARIQTHVLLHHVQQHLEERVRARTLDLVRINDQLTQEVEKRRQKEEALRVSEERFRALYDDTPSMYFTVAPDGTVLSVNEFGAAQLGYTPAELMGQSVLGVFHPDDVMSATQHVAECIAEPGRMFHWELRKQHKDGSLMWVKETARAVRAPDGGLVALIVCEDITERKRSEERLSFLTHYDVLTGLPNRTLFHDRLNQSIVEAPRRERLVVLMYLDLDRFKNITDSLGYAAGDLLLQEVAQRLSQCLRPGDTVARITGDEFALVLSDLASFDDATRMAQKVLSVFTQPFHAAGRELFITASLGVTIYPHDGEYSDTLLRNAEVATFRAKEAGRNMYQFYTAEMTSKAVENLALENELHQAIGREELLLYYQPIVTADKGALLGFEALARWRHSRRGMIPPERFVPLAEETGLIIPLGEWVLREACRQCRAWQREGYSGLRMAVNLSARQLQQNSFLHTLKRVLMETELEPTSLELEITESVLLKNVGGTLELLRALTDMGVALSIDDFGTGYSSLSYLKRFPVKVLKIDSSFTRDIPGDPDDAALAQAIISIGHTLGLKVIAEGVESREQREFLRANGCDALQGNYFSKPLPAKELLPLLHAHTYPMFAY